MTTYRFSGTGIFNSGGSYSFNVPHSITTYDAAIASLGPVGWWKLADHVGASVATDSSGNGYNLTTSGSVVFGQPGPIPSDTAALFDGSTGYASTTGASGALASALNNNSFTIVEWVKFTSGAAAFTTLDVQNPSGGTDTDVDLEISIGAVALHLGSDTAQVSLGTGIATGTWHFICGTYVVSTKTFTAFVDGASVGTATTSGTPNVTTSPSVFIGALGGTQRYFPGDLAQIAVFSYILSPTQIASLYTIA